MLNFLSTHAITIPVKKRRFLVIDSDVDYAQLTLSHLKELNADITLAHDGNQGLELARSQEWDLLILDIRLSGKNGLDICRELREQNNQAPIVVLTARNTELDHVLSLELGADDYVTKPHSALELVARVKALVRRSEYLLKQSMIHGEKLNNHQLRIHHISINKSQRKATIQHNSLDLTAREFDLLWLFVEQPGRVFSRCELLHKVWGDHYQGYENTVNSHINRLRSKIERDPANPSLLLTVWGVGYKLLEEAH